MLYAIIGLNIIVLGLLIVLFLKLLIKEKGAEKIEHWLRDEMSLSRKEAAAAIRDLREEVNGTLLKTNDFLLTRLNQNLSAQLEQIEIMRRTVEERLKILQDDNNLKLEQMRATVDEKLNATLEKRLGESFRLVSERLEKVHQGLGEMQQLASGVGDLKRVLTNVKARGVWGEVHLESLLEQILTPQQYDKNVITRPGGKEFVEFAVKLPAKDKEDSYIWLPIDAKFPQEDYQRLLDAQEQANPIQAEEAAKALESRIKQEAKHIAEKYLCPPSTTDFGVLFLPIEGLYAEVLRRPGIYETLIREYRVVVTGPTTLAAFLSSLQMGFRTLAVEKRSSEVWKLLGAVKSEFAKFGELLEKTQKKLEDASKSIDTAARKSRTIERKLKDVEELPASEATELITSNEDR